MFLQVENYPWPNPQTLAELQIPQELSVTLQGDPFVLFDSGDNDPDRLIMFGTDQSLNWLIDSTELFSDATFKVRPFKSCRIYFTLILS